jgi:hypothetical protein
MTLVNRISTRFPEFVLLAVALGFTGLFVELTTVEHYRRGTQIIGYVSTIVGFLAVLLAFVRARWARNTSLVVLGLLALAGLLGVWEHQESRAEDYARWQKRQAAASSTTTTTTAPQGEQGGEGGPPSNVFRSDIPYLAPLSLSGLAILAGASILARREEAPRVRRAA